VKRTVTGRNDFGSFYANQNAIIEMNLSFTFPGGTFPFVAACLPACLRLSVWPASACVRQARLTGAGRHSILSLSVHSSVTKFVKQKNDRVLVLIGTSDPRINGMKRSKVKGQGHARPKVG